MYSVSLERVMRLFSSHPVSPVVFLFSSLEVVNDYRERFGDQ